MMGITRCLCGGLEDDVLGEKDGRRVGKCRRCGLIRTLTVPYDYSDLYTEGERYHAGRDGHTPYRERYDHDREVADLRLRVLQEFQNPRLLDVGCANGAFVEAAWQWGYNSEGFELNPHIAAWAYAKVHRPIHTSWDSVVGPFDIITVHDVIEHMPTPHDDLTRLRKLLVHDGFLVIDTPDAGHERFVAEPMASHHMKPVEHLWYFRQEDLTRLLVETGFHPPRYDRPIPGKIVAYARRAV
jgi:SAM-dependent methyltransferase